MEAMFRMKKILTGLLSVAILLTVVSSMAFTAAAAGEVTMSVKEVSAKAGQTVTTELIMNGTFAGFQGKLEYDTDALTLEKIETTKAITGSGNMTMFQEDQATGKFISGSFVNASPTDKTVNGAVLKFTFKATSKANGTYKFRLTQIKVLDAAFKNVPVKADGTVEVKVKSDPPITQGEEPPVTDDDTSSKKPNKPTSSKDNNQQESGQNSEVSAASGDDEPGADASLTASVTGEPGAVVSSPEGNETGKVSLFQGNGLIFLLIISVIVIAGIVLIVIVIRKRRRY